VTQDSVVGGSAIISSIGGELVDLIIDLIKQWLQLRGVTFRSTVATGTATDRLVRYA
jgi:hypothetical protein